MIRYLCTGSSDCLSVWYIPFHTDRCRMALGSRNESSPHTDWWSCCDTHLCRSSTGHRSSRPHTHTLPESHNKVLPPHSYTGSHSQRPNCLSCYNLKWKQVFSTILWLTGKNDQRGAILSASIQCSLLAYFYWKFMKYIIKNLLSSAQYNKLYSISNTVEFMDVNIHVIICLELGLSVILCLLWHVFLSASRPVPGGQEQWNPPTMLLQR